MSRLHHLIKDPGQLLVEVISEIDKCRITAVAERFTREWKSAAMSNGREFVRDTVKRVTLGESDAWILVSTKTVIEKLLEKNLHGDIELSPNIKDVTLSADFRTRRHGGALQLVSPGIEKTERQPLPSFLHMVARARGWYERIADGEVQSIEALAKEVKMTPRSTRRVLRWAALSPRLLESTLRGDCRPNLTDKRYLKEFPLDWQSQESYFLQTPI